MYATVDGFSYGFVTPLAAYAVACLSGALGLRCLTTALGIAQPRRARRLALGAGALGTGVWITHFVAMMGVTVTRTTLDYDLATTFASLAVAIVMVGAGIFIVASRGITSTGLFTGGTITGLGVASMHFTGMAGVRIGGRLEYNTSTVVASVLIAVVASIGALWVVGQGRGFAWSVGASLLMGVAVLGMHYVSMAAVSVHLHDSAAHASGDSPTKTLALMMIGPVALLLLIAALVLRDPKLLTTAPGHDPLPSARQTAILPTQRVRDSASSRPRASQHR